MDMWKGIDFNFVRGKSLLSLELEYSEALRE